MEIVAIIPARGGSRGIKNKNLLTLCKISLLGRSILNAKKCKQISRVLVSTDSKVIAKEALAYGAEVPFMRPPKLSTDTAETIDAFIHALNWLQEKEAYKPDVVMCLQCTSPFVQPYHLEKAINLFTTKQAKAVFSACEAAYHPMKMGNLDSQGKWQHLLCRPSETCRQKLDKVYQHNGALYIVDAQTLATEKTWFPDETFPYIMDCDISSDIDTKDDLNYLKFLLQQKKYQDLYKP